MPRPARRPAPITLPNYPMDTLWEVDESLEQAPTLPRSRSQPEPLRSVFEDDDDEVRNVAFPLPPRALPPMRRFFKMSLPIHSPPRPRPSSRSPPKPTRAPPPIPRPVSPAVLVTRPVSPSSSASSSDTEPPRTPPAASPSLPAYVLAPPPPAEWESAIDALFEFDEEEEEISSKWSSSSSTPRASPIPVIRPTDSYLSFSPPCSPPRMSFMHGAKSPLPPSMSVYASDSLPMSPTFSRPLASPGLMPTSPTSPAQCQWSVPSRPPRSSRRMGTIPVRIES